MIRTVTDPAFAAYGSAHICEKYTVARLAAAVNVSSTAFSAIYWHAPGQVHHPHPAGGI